MDRSECGVRHKWDHVETERRREAFNAWVRTQANKAGFRLMPPAVQGIVHGMLRVAFYAGSNWQRRHGAIAAAPPPPAEQASGELTDEQCDAFRQMPGSFRDMVRMIYRAGQKGTFAPQQPEKGEG